MNTFELLDELSKKTKYELKYALVSLMLAGKKMSWYERNKENEL